MRTKSTRRSRKGFSAVEVVLVIAIVGILATMGIPWIINIVHKTKMEGLLNKTGFLFHIAKSESIKQNFNTVVRFDIAGRRIISFADVNGPVLGTPPDGVFNPIAGEPDRTTDYRLAIYDVPNGIDFDAPGAQDLIDSFTTVDNGGTDEQVAIFLPDGSIVDVGAVRLGGARGNLFEIRVAPQGTARVQTRKWDEAEGEWFEQGEEDRVWEWL
jgi:prepilin-type N-terminal cleavage/methylation domain-containing protein